MTKILNHNTYHSQEIAITVSGTQTLSDCANSIVTRFNTTIGSHRRLTAAQHLALENEETVRVISGTADRPVIELTLQFRPPVVLIKIAVDPTLPVRMHTQATQLAARFYALQAAERNS